MLYIVEGENFKKAGEYIRERIAEFPNASVFSYEPDHFNEAICEEALSTQGLFGERMVIIFNGLFEDGTYEEYLLNKAPEYAASETIFVIREKKMRAPQRKKLSTHAKEIVHFSEEREPARGFSIFSLSDALGRRDKKNAWLLLQTAQASGMSPEQIYGTLFWQAKTMYMVKKTQEEGGDVHALGLKPFVVRKAQQFGKQYSEKECKALLSSLLDAYHNARKGVEELSIGLERIMLTL